MVAIDKLLWPIIINCGFHIRTLIGLLALESVLHILCVTEFVTSSIAVFEVAMRVKSTHLMKSFLKTREKEKIWK